MTLRNVRTMADRTKAINGAATKERKKSQRKWNPLSETVQYPARAPSRAYVMLPFILKNLRVVSTIREDIRTGSIALQSNPLSVQHSLNDSPTAFVPLCTIAIESSRRMSTSQLQSRCLIVQVGPYTPERVRYSLAKNQRADVDKNNMRQSISMLKGSSDSHHCELVCYIFRSLCQILDMKGEVSKMKFLAELKIGHIVKYSPFDRL